VRQRYAARTDTTQAAIVEAIRAAGWHVWLIREPCDLLCWHPSDVWQPLECKTPTAAGTLRIRKDQLLQNIFCDLTFTPRVTTPEQAIEFLQRRLGRTK
jgi:hypothetical protein